MLRITASGRQSRKLRALGALLAVTVGALAPLGMPMQANADDTVVLRKVDTSDYPNVELTVLKPSAGALNSDIKVTENGKAITNVQVSTLEETGVTTGVVLVIDTSEAMRDGDALNKVKTAAIEMVSAKAPNQKFAIIATNGTARPVVTFTDDRAALISGIETLQATQQNALWGGVRQAAGLLQNAPDLQANTVIISGSLDQLSPAGTFTAARSQLRTAKSVVTTVAVRQREDIHVDNLKMLASDTGGRYIETNDPASVSRILADVSANLADQVVVRYSSPSTSKELDISVAIGSGTATAHASPGTVSEGAAVAPAVIESGGGPAFLSGWIGLALIAVVSCACVALLLYGIIEIASKQRNQLSAVLRPYSDEPDEDRDVSKLADSEIMKKAVAQTAKFANDRGFLDVIQRRLEQADLPLRPAEALFFTGVAALIGMLLGAILFDFLGLAAAALLFLLLPYMVTGAMAKMRKRKFTSQLPDTLQLLSGSLRAGYSLMQGLDAVSKQCEAPMGTELQRAMSEARLGRPVEEALQEMSDRLDSDDFEWTVMAIRIQREVGGNLAELLMTVSETMIARERLRREVKALTAEGRVSAVVLSVLPPGIGVVISVLNPTYMAPMLSATIGQWALGGAGLMIIIGYMVMNKLIEIEA